MKRYLAFLAITLAATAQAGPLQPGGSRCVRAGAFSTCGPVTTSYSRVSVSVAEAGTDLIVSRSGAASVPIIVNGSHRDVPVGETIEAIRVRKTAIVPPVKNLASRVIRSPNLWGLIGSMVANELINLGYEWVEEQKNYMKSGKPEEDPFAPKYMACNQRTGACADTYGPFGDGSLFKCRAETMSGHKYVSTLMFLRRVSTLLESLFADLQSVFQFKNIKFAN